MSKQSALTAILAILLSFSAFSQSITIEGSIIDSLTQKPIEGAVFEAISQQASSAQHFSAYTNSKGRFSVNLPSGSYAFVASALGYANYYEILTINESKTMVLELSSQPVSLGEIVVSSFRVNRKVKELPTPLAVVGSSEYQKQSSLTLANVLNNEPGISMGSDGVWSTSINIRGLSENRLVSLVDGNRIETATDLTASLSMIDVNDIDRVEVVKGAQSSLYGSGAMGGIVNIITKDGHFENTPYLKGNVISGVASANELFNGHLGITAGAEKWYVRLSGSYLDANDMRTPEGILPNSQFKSNNLSAKIGFKPFANHTLKLQYQRYWAKDVGIPGGNAFPGPATATYTDIGRNLISASYEIENITKILSSLKLSYFNQFILRDVALYPNTISEVPLATGVQRITPMIFTPTGEHLTNGLQLQSTWQLSPKNTLIAGVDAWARELYTEREKFIKVEVFNTAGDLLVTNNLVRGETPNPGSTFSSAGLYVHDETRLLNDRLTLVLGGRVDGVWVENETGFDIDYLIVNGVRNDTPPNQRITFPAGTENSLSWSANAGVLINIASDVDLSLNMARSFRSPSLEERFKYIDLGNMVRLGDPKLNPESGYSLDLGLRIWKQKFSMQLGVFSNWISDMIVETPGEFIYTINTGPLEGVVDTLPALINANVTKAMLYGADFGFQYNFYRNVVAFGSGAYVIGMDTNNDTNLPQIPPLNGRLGLRYTLPRIGAVEIAIIGASDQDKVAEGEKITSGYARYDFAINSSKMYLGASNIQLFAGIENLTDKKYTNHLASNRGAISVEPGRNVYIKLNITF